MEKFVRLSVFCGTEPYEMAHVDDELEVSWADLPQLITSTAYSPSLFKDRHRKNKNFLATDILVLDVDNGGLEGGGPTLEAATEVFRSYRAVIAPTKNHRKEKKTESGEVKPACDRYRVAIPLSNAITRAEDFRSTWQAALDRWPFIDGGCCDEARYYAPSVSVAHFLEGEPFPVATATVTPGKKSSCGTASARPQPHVQHDASHLLHRRLPLSPTTWEFITNPPETGWRKALVKATYDAKQQGWDKYEWKQLASLATTNPEQQLDSEDHRAIDDIYEYRETHPPRLPCTNSSAFTRGHGDRTQDVSDALIPTDDETLAEIESDERLRQMALDNPIKLSFIRHAKYGAFNLPMGSTLFGARSGRGKSATAANILADVIRHYPEKRCLVLTNEETTEGVFNRVACAFVGKSFAMLQDGRLSPEDVQEIKQCIREKLIPRLKIRQRITTVEDAIAVFEAAVRHEPPFDLILVDYLQNIKTSKNSPDAKAWDSIKAFGDYLAEFGTRVITRVVVMAQLRKNSDAEDFQDRVQYDKTFLQHMKVGIEINPNFDTQKTEFTIHKHRDGVWHVGAKAGADFDESTFRYLPITQALKNFGSNKIKLRSLDQVGLQASSSIMPTDGEASQSDDAVPF